MFTLNCKGRLLQMTGPVVMGIINTTPDSFYPGSRLKGIEDIVSRAAQMIADGAAILDIGGQSTRPKSTTISADEEMDRVLPAIEAIHKNFPRQVLSVDTFYAKVARAAVHAGASIVNDISAGSMDENLLATVSNLQVPYVLMHKLGNPQTMQENPVYGNVTLDVFDFLNFKISELVAMGINDIIIDPGFGFGKTSVHNFQLLRSLSWFQQLQRPLMVGLSRKATIYRTLQTGPEEALNGSTVMHTIALMNGAGILRVHDVKEAMQAVRLFAAYNAEEQL